MTLPLFFGRPERRLYGMHHRARKVRGHLLICAPLLQEGMRCHRSLWALAEALADAGVSSLRFDWFGSGDSAGDSSGLTLQGMLEDLAAARGEVSADDGDPARCRLFALRGAALPLLAHVRAEGKPARIVLWDPVLVGHDLVADWQRQHAWQLTSSGRFPRPGVADPDEMLGFDVSDQLLGRLARLDALHMELPAGSEVLLATWDFLPSHRQFVESQQQVGVRVDVVTLDPEDRIDWNDPQAFELQAFPRRSVARLAAWLARGAGA